MSQTLRWDIFCRVIDNFGDIGVCWRLSCALGCRGQVVRLWVDDASALSWMAPQGCVGVEVRSWQPEQPIPSDALPADVVMEAFGCEIDPSWVAMKRVALRADSTPAEGRKGFKNTVWINLEYLSAESYVERSHGLPSPVMAGAARGMTKWFFYPGFTQGTGGLIREPEALSDQIDTPATQRISLFCYEPPALSELIEQLAHDDQSTALMVMPGRGQQALQREILSKNAQSPAWNLRKVLSIHEQPYMPQQHYDTLLRSCDLNFVRGEDSLVRALWAGRAFVWQIYPQADGAHADKLEAFLDWLKAPADLREFHRVWNGLKRAALPRFDLCAWQNCVRNARAELLMQPDLVTQLLDFVEEKRSQTV
ncbi:elongation factor P maturation arginine rhamnosyltransferase EarP [Variovorax sp. PCZ-1]|uniref:elongation factor P maturation arginine rhamnosyltransferase EarP n=1 Tax=Variovorax sp. PCZ-1 TaxID=2835533 RepID=UPI001BCF5106|nr:elongation factor P maturation arginine rhamnosyltransferase EarP [Variovorax sp. PCZ-1]MBS7808072.1 elongation factor P maturation arginine rhamnosyltransferase EarP [Variovorax sp. PCZ-1]